GAEMAKTRVRGRPPLRGSGTRRNGPPPRGTNAGRARGTGGGRSVLDTLRAQSEALSKYLAQQAAASPALRRFRRDILGGRPLAPEEARGFLRSPTMRFLQRGQFQRLGIPIAGHGARLLDLRPDPKRPSVWTAKVGITFSGKRLVQTSSDRVSETPQQVGPRLPELSFPVGP